MSILYVFAYGSLINEESLKKTIGNKESHIHPCIAKDYRRSWNYTTKIYSHELKQTVTGIFLSIYSSPGSYVNGVLIKVDAHQLNELIKREKGYELVDISNRILPFPGEKLPSVNKVLTFVSPKCEITNDSYIFKKYIGIVEYGCSSISSKFLQCYIKTTDSSKISIVRGDYTFDDKEQESTH